MRLKTFTLVGLAYALVLSACSGNSSGASISLPVPDSLNLSGQEGETLNARFSFKNMGTAPLTYRVDSNSDWLTATPQAGTLSPGGAASTAVKADCESAQQSGTLTITSDALEGTQTVKVKLTCDPKSDPAPSSAYSIDIVPLGSDFTPERIEVFEKAAALWATAITGDLASLQVTHPTNGACSFGEPAFEGLVDDLRIYASIAYIDGAGGVLGQAGPSFIRSEDELTIVGCMQFDVADVEALEDNGTFDETILHEMGHVLGIGVLWEPIPPINSRDLLTYTTTPEGQNCSAPSTSFTEPPKFTGSAAVAEFAVLGGSGNVPVEEGFGPGTKCGHWDEAHFATEIMTGFLGPGIVNPISRMTIASLQDLGYEVDLSKAEPYSIPPCSPGCSNLQAQGQAIRERLLLPKFAVLPDGRLRSLTGE